MKNKKGFVPSQIIFAATEACNLHCSHCFVSQTPAKLDYEDAIKFLESCKDSCINTVGFSGGEPFLASDFICKVSEYACKNDFLFDRIMTNGVWWNTQNQLVEILTRVYNSGYDGKIGLSYDSFHNQPYSKILAFIKTVYSIWNNTSMIEIQSVISDNPNDKIQDLENFEKLSEDLNTEVSLNLDKTGKGIIVLQNDQIFLPIYRTEQSFSSEDKRAWNSKKWFKDDFCEGPGQILFVHSNGNIVPCCGFANENEKLVIGSITDNLQTVLKNACSNKMVELCYTNGLSKAIKICKKNKIRIPGKTTDICAFCDFVCKNL